MVFLNDYAPEPDKTKVLYGNGNIIKKDTRDFFMGKAEPGSFF